MANCEEHERSNRRLDAADLKAMRDLKAMEREEQEAAERRRDAQQKAKDKLHKAQQLGSYIKKAAVQQQVSKRHKQKFPRRSSFPSSHLTFPPLPPSLSCTAPREGRRGETKELTRMASTGEQDMKEKDGREDVLDESESEPSACGCEEVRAKSEPNHLHLTRLTTHHSPLPPPFPPQNQATREALKR